MALAASAGLHLDPWQQVILEHSLGERADGKWSAFEVALMVSRQNGKGSVLEARELAGLVLFGEKLIMHTAHELKTSLEAFRRVEALFDSDPSLRRMIKRVSNTNGNEGIELHNGGRLRFVARSKGSGRGFSGDLIILDEAYALTPEQIEALLPTMSARPNSQLWYTSSPPLDSASGAVLFAVRRRGLAGADGLAYFDFGAEGDLANLSQIDLDDRALWRRTNPACPDRITEEFIARERGAMTDPGFARERLGVWPSEVTAGRVIDPQTWAGLVDEESEHGEVVAFAIDVTPTRDYASIAVCGLRPDGAEHVELVEHNPGTEWLVPRLVELRRAWNPVAIGLDVMGPAGSLLIELEAAGIKRPDDHDKPRRGDLAIPTTREVVAAVGSLVDAVRRGTVHHVDQAQLNTAVAGAKTRPLGDAYAWARRTAGIDISPLVAVTIARWAYATRSHIADEPEYDALAQIW